MKKKMDIELPDKIFGIDSGLITLFVPAVLVTIVAVILFNLFVFPLLSETGDIRTSTASINERTKTLKSKVTYLKSLDQQQLKDNESMVTSALLPERNSYYLVNVIRKIADKHQFRVESFSVRLGEVGTTAVETTTGKGYSTIPVNMILVGPSDGYINIAKALERSLPILTINTFEMSNTSGVSVIELGVVGYYLSEKKIIDADKLTLADLTLKDDESKVMGTLSDFEVVEDSNSIEGKFQNGGSFTKYNRTDPFNQ